MTRSHSFLLALRCTDAPPLYLIDEWGSHMIRFGGGEGGAPPCRQFQAGNCSFGESEPWWKSCQMLKRHLAWGSSLRHQTQPTPTESLPLQPRVVRFLARSGREAQLAHFPPPVILGAGRSEPFPHASSTRFVSSNTSFQYCCSSFMQRVDGPHVTEDWLMMRRRGIGYSMVQVETVG